MFTKQAVIDTIYYIKSKYDDEFYCVNGYCFDSIVNIFNLNTLNIFRNTNSTFIMLYGIEIILSDEHKYSNDVFKIYNDDQYPFYITILTNDERTIQEIIE